MSSRATSEASPSGSVTRMRVSRPPAPNSAAILANVARRLGIDIYNPRLEAQHIGVPTAPPRPTADTPRRRDDEPGLLAELDRW